MRGRRLLSGVTVTPFLVVGCGQILGLDGESTLGVKSGDAGSQDNPIGNKDCDGQLVPLDDPRHGCASESCDPCSVPFATEAKCVRGVCAVAHCPPDRADCNRNGADGCEVNLLAATTCGSCDTACGGSTPFCSNNGSTIQCVATCGAGLTACDNSCVDTKTSVDHCSGCGKKCSGNATADPVCNDGSCELKCQAGLQPCGTEGAAAGCGTARTFYEDKDGDLHGNAQASVQACNPPGGYVVTGDDCFDNNASVFPGQTEYFGMGYAKNGVLSYDYDCSGVEEEQAGFTHFVACTPPACNQNGYVQHDQGQANKWCGSTMIQGCVSMSAAMCGPSVGLSSSPIRCH